MLCRANGHYHAQLGECLIYRQVSFDTAHVSLDQPGSATFFDAAPNPSMDDSSARVTAFDEKPIIRWLMLCPFSRQIIFEELGLPPDAFHRPEVVQPFYAPSEGDIDLILCPRLSPHQAVAFECKRVKIESVNIGEDKVNKLRDVAGGVRQANKLYNGNAAFFQTYLAIIIEVDASGQGEINIPNRGIRSDTTPQHGDTRTTTFKQIVEFPGRAELHDDVGIIFIEIVQPSHLSIDKQVSVRICVYRRAERRDQLTGVTNRVIKIMQ